MIRGSAKIDSIAVGEISASFLGATVHLEAKAAFANSKTGDTHGWTKNAQWTPPVLEKLKELRALMEMDLGRIHFESTELIETGAPAARGVRFEGGGLGEHLDAPSI